MSKIALVHDNRAARQLEQAGGGRMAAEVEVVLASRFLRVTRRNPLTWSFKVSHRHSAYGSACIEGEWLAITASMNESELPKPWTPWMQLQHNRLLSGGVKWALAGNERAPYARADLSLRDNGSRDVHVLRSRLDAMCDGIESALDAPGVRHANSTETGECPADLDWVETCCTDAGWIVERSSEAGLRVALESPARASRSARVEHDGVQSRFRVELCPADASPTSAEHKQVVATFLLAACGSVRMARPFVAQVIELESPVPTQCRAGDIHRILSALSVAYARCGRETLALIDAPSLASSYLRL